MSPDAGEAVRLQLDRHGAALRALGDSGQTLHVVPYLVRDDVGAREVSGRSETVAELLEKAEIEVYASIVGTVERSRRRLRHAATRIDRIAEEDDARLAVAGQNLRP